MKYNADILRQLKKKKSYGRSDSKESTCNAGDPGLIPGSGRSPGGGNGNPFWYSLLENSMDRGSWWTIVHGLTESNTTERLTLSFSCHLQILNYMNYTFLILGNQRKSSNKLDAEANVSSVDNHDLRFQKFMYIQTVLFLSLTDLIIKK